MSEIVWVPRPWGAYGVVHTDAETTVKILRVRPQSALSFQLHEHRDERWTLLAPDNWERGRDGLVRFIIDGKVLTAVPYVVYDVPRRVAHRIINDSTDTVEIVEVMKGRYDEDDITRIQDNYGRA